MCPYLFSLESDEITKDIQSEIPWCMLCADDIVRIGKNSEKVNGRIKEWREVLEDTGLWISRSKIEHIKYDFRERDQEVHRGGKEIS